MIWIDIAVTLIFIFSFIGGLKEGAVKSFFSLLTLFIVIPLTGFLYLYFVSVLSFIPDQIWRNFIGFFGTFIVLSIILSLIFLIPSRLLGGIWDKGVLSILLGGLFAVIGCAISLVLLRIVVQTYPIFDWLDHILTNSRVISWFAPYLDFIRLMLPEVFRGGGAITVMFLNRIF